MIRRVTIALGLLTIAVWLVQVVRPSEKIGFPLQRSSASVIVIPDSLAPKPLRSM